MTVGVLYASSTAHPYMGVDFIDGIKAYLQMNGASTPVHVQLMVEGIGFGGSEKEVYSKAEKLLRIEKADVLVAFIDLRVLPMLEPLVYSLGKLLIVVNAGANYPYNWVPQPNVMFLGLQHAFLCYLTGKLATASSSAQAAVATSFYDCGYLHVAAMVNGFTQQGGQITYNFVHPQTYEAFDISSLSVFLTSNTATDHLLCLFDELPAGLFYQRLAAIPRAAALQLFVSPMMLEEKALHSLPAEAPFFIQGYRSWLPEANNEPNQLFTKTYRALAKKEASVFALLGWETGQVLHTILQPGSGEPLAGPAALEKLKETAWQSPRGTVQLDEETHYLLAPAVQYTIQNGEVTTQQVPLSTMQEYWLSFSARPAEGVSSGWTNTYLCY